MDKIVLEATNISKSYDNGDQRLQVLQDISLSIKEKEIITITGHSGSGKSTLLNILGTLDRPDSGIVKINNTNVNNQNDVSISKIRNTHLGFVFQFHHLLAEFTAIENVLIPTWISQRKKADTYAYTLFQDLGLENRINHFPNQLSGGEKSRVSLIRAIINKPSLVLADEPTGNLDKKNSIKLIDLIRKINEYYSQSFIITTHNPDVASIGECKYILNNGSLESI